MKHLLSVTSGHSVTHLSEHRCDEAQPGPGEELRRVERGQQAGSGWCTGRRIGRVIRILGTVVIARLLQKIEQIFSWNELEDKQQEGRRFKGPMKSDDVWVALQRLVYSNLIVRSVHVHACEISAEEEKKE